MTYKPIRYSGLRIGYLPEAEKERAWRQRLTDIQWLLPYLRDALAEQFFADDAIVDMNFDDIVRMALHNSEVFGCVHDEEVVGFVVLRDIRPGRDAYMLGYTVPKYRGKYPGAKLIREIIDYAFTPWNPEQSNSQKFAPKGLGLRKLKAYISAANKPAGKLLTGLGFFTTGISLMDGLFKGNVTDMILLEKFNPLYFPRNQENVIRRGQQQSESTTSTSVHPGTGLGEAEAVHSSESGEQRVRKVRTAGGDGEPGNTGRPAGSRRGAGARQRLAEPVKEPDGPVQHEPSGERLSPEAGIAAVGIGRVIVKRKRSRRK